MANERTKANLRSFERTRAANIVGSYELELGNLLAANPGAKNAQQVERVMTRLRMIRREIMGSVPIYKEPIKRDPGGDFSHAEIEAAMEFMQTEEAEDPFK